MERQEKRKIWSWVSYDMGNSVFAVTVMAGFFPIFFKSYWSGDAAASLSTARLGYAVSFASLFVALAAPLLGTFSDNKSNKRFFLALFASFGFLCTASLSLIGAGGWVWAILAYCGAISGFYLANIFYDSLLVNLVGPTKRAWVSGLGYAFGYLSGGLVFAINVWMTLSPQTFGLFDITTAVKVSFLFAALFWALGTWVCFSGVPEKSDNKPRQDNLKATWKTLKSTFQTVKQHRPAWTFLLSYWLYIDVVNTLVVMAVDYGMSLGFESKDLILALLMVQWIGFPAALGVAKLGEKFSVKKALLLCLAVYGFVCIWATLLEQKWEFFLLAGLIGLTQGGIQALSRSYYANLIPENQAGEFFGFYNMLGKFATILGPLLVATVGLVAHALFGEQGLGIAHLDSRLGFGSLLVPLCIGAWVFIKSTTMAPSQP